MMQQLLKLLEETCQEYTKKLHTTNMRSYYFLFIGGNDVNIGKLF